MPPCRSCCTIDALRGRGLVLTACLAASVLALGVPVARAASPVAAAAPVRHPGQSVWQPWAAPNGPLVIVVSLDEQRLHVYRNGIAIGSSAVSSGRPGHETPTGVFTILQKERDHRSNLYDDAPMPYMERLTWDGLALHGGALPGYPASHGCVRLPHAFAERLFEVTRRGDTVVVAGGAAAPLEIVHPSVLAPVTPAGVAMDWRDPAGEAWQWDESAAPPGPVSIVVSVGGRRVHVLRNGVRIGSAHLDVTEGFAFHGATVFVRLPDAATPPPAVAGAAPRWAMYRLRGAARIAPAMDGLAAALKVPDAFAARVQATLVPGTSVLVVDSTATGTAANAERGLEKVLESEPR